MGGGLGGDVGDAWWNEFEFSGGGDEWNGAELRNGHPSGRRRCDK